MCLAKKEWDLLLRAHVNLYKVQNLLGSRAVTTVGGKLLPIDQNISEVSICCHSDTPVNVADCYSLCAAPDIYHITGCSCDRTGSEGVGR